MDGRHLEDAPFPPANPEDRVLNDHRERLHHEESPYHRQEQLRFGQYRGGGEQTSDGERPRIAHKDVRRMRVVPEKPDDGPYHRPADDRHIVLPLEERDGRVDQKRYGPGTCGEPVETVRQVDGVGGSDDHEQKKEAEERYPHHARPEYQVTVE